MTTEVAAIHLEDIAETKKKINDLHEVIVKKEEEAGITTLKDELHTLEDTYKRQVATAVEQNIFEEDHYHLVNKGRVMTVVTPTLLHERYPDIFWKSIKVTKGVVMDRLQWMFEDAGESRSAAKKMAAEVVESIATKSQSGNNYELVDLLEGV